MNGMRILGAVCASILGTSFGTLAACGGGSPELTEAKTAESVNAASVSIALMDESGAKIGDGSGVLIAPRLVLTSGHLVVSPGKGKWVVTSADGKTKVSGARAVTYDWLQYDSQKAHPRKHDVGVIYLDDSIKLSSYPKLVTDRSADGAKATRIRGTGAGFQTVESILGRVQGAPNSYLSDIGLETLDTGGAVYNGQGIVGIVSGKGLTTNKLYIARTDRLAKWLAPKIACSGGALGARTYSSPQQDKSEAICEDGGISTTTSGGPGSNGNGGTPGENSCGEDNNGYCHGHNCGSNSSNPGSNGGAGSSSGSSGSDGHNNPGDDNGNPGDEGSGGPNTGGAGSSSGSSGGDGHNNPGGNGNPGGDNPGGAGTTNSSSGSPGGDNNGGPTQGGAGTQGSGADGDNGEVCQGANDNPETCPPEPDGCAGAGCGGGQPDDRIDYGNCACGTSVTGTLVH
jgi:hypothetical protein